MLGLLYAPIEGEALAVADALDKARFFVQGCNVLTIAVDHKPLPKDRSLEDIPNARLRNLKEKTLRYRFKMVNIHTSVHTLTPSAGPPQPDMMVHPDDIGTCSGPQDSSPLVDYSGDIFGRDNTEPTSVLTSTNAISTTAITWHNVKIATASGPNPNSYLHPPIPRLGGSPPTLTSGLPSLQLPC
jgi:hypothetical protein